jgi:hypothetical protein
MIVRKHRRITGELHIIARVQFALMNVYTMALFLILTPEVLSALITETVTDAVFVTELPHIHGEAVKPAAAAVKSAQPLIYAPKHPALFREWCRVR